MHNKLFVSLGVDCRVKYQISRAAAYSQNPNITKAEFEAGLYGSSRSASGHGTFFFDWLVTPIEALRHCIESDFKDVFEQDDLEINKTQTGVVSRKLNITFQHNFSKTDGKILPSTIKSEFDTQKRKISYLENKTKELLNSDQSVNFIRVGGSVNSIEAIANSMTDRNKLKKFKIFLVEQSDSNDKIVHEISNSIHTYNMSRENSKPELAKWQGDDHHWSTFFQKIADIAV